MCGNKNPHGRRSGFLDHGGCLLRVNFRGGQLLLPLLDGGLDPKQEKVLQGDQGSRGGSARILEGDYKGGSRVWAISRGFFDPAGKLSRGGGGNRNEARASLQAGTIREE